jgi:hypothetical protein
MELLPLPASIITGDMDDRPLELVSRFVDLLGSSSEQLSSVGDDGKHLTECLSSTLEDKDLVCRLPTFHAADAEVQIYERQEKLPSIFWNELESGVRSKLYFPVLAEAEAQPNKEEKHSHGIYTKNSVNTAPLNLLRKLQQALRFYICSRLDEWKVLLQRQTSCEANELVELLTYNKLIKGCRGNTTMRIDGFWEKTQRDGYGILSDGETDRTGCHFKASSALSCRLLVHFFVKLRHSPRAFDTSSFTLTFTNTGIVRCEWVVSFDCEKDDY